MLQSLFVSITSNGFIVAAVAAVILICLVLLFLNRGKQSCSPFTEDIPYPQTYRATPQAQKDKVIKNGFSRKKVPENLDAIIIGSGIGGLSVAATLARSGKKVLVLEQHDQAGGNCHTFVEKGYEFDTGIHYVGQMHERSMAKLFLDQCSDGQIGWCQMDQAYDILSLGKPGENRTYNILSGRNEYRRQLVEYFPDEEEAIDKFIAYTKKFGVGYVMFMLKLIPKWILTIVSASGLLNLMTNFLKQTQRTTLTVVSELTSNKDLQAVLTYIFGDYGTAPKRSPFPLHCLYVQHYWNGAYYPLGGPAEISYHIVSFIEKHGGKVLVRANVSEILLDDNQNKVLGVRVIKGQEPCDIFAPLVISNAGVYNTFEKLLPQEIADKERERYGYLHYVKHGISFVSLFIGFNRDTSSLNLPGSNLWAFNSNSIDDDMEEYLSMTAAEAARNCPPMLFISFPSAKDSSWSERHPNKAVCVMLTLARYDWFEQWENNRVMHRGDDYMSLKEEFGKRMWERTCQFYPQLTDCVDYFDVSTPLSYQYYLNSSKGDSYGCELDVNRFSFEGITSLRPQTSISGLYMTGQDILLGGLTGALMSGFGCSCAILGRNLSNDLKILLKKRKKH